VILRLRNLLARFILKAGGLIAGSAASPKKTEVEQYLSWLCTRGLKVGRNLNLQRDVIIDDNHCWHITIGDDVTIAPRAYILAHDASTKTHLGFTRIAPVNIGSRVFIGAHAVILPGVNIGDDAIIGAGSIVSGDIPPRTVAAGNPAKVLCTLDDFLQKRRLERTTAPEFGVEFTIEAGITDAQKTEMARRMNGGPGYIV
jgi:maltose O-acetyltransferase